MTCCGENFVFPDYLPPVPDSPKAFIARTMRMVEYDHCSRFPEKMDHDCTEKEISRIFKAANGEKK